MKSKKTIPDHPWVEVENHESSHGDNEASRGLTLDLQSRFRKSWGDIDIPSGYD